MWYEQARQRLLLTALIGIAAGALTTTGVAWTLSETRGLGPYSLAQDHLTLRSTPYHVLEEHRIGEVTRLFTFGDPYHEKAALRSLSSSVARWGRAHMAESEWVEQAHGWPAPALWKWQAQYAPMLGAIELPARAGTSYYPGQNFRGLPLLPIWRGLIINTAFYAFIWIALILVVGQLRAIRRRRRKSCPECSYNLNGLTTLGCPECGWGRAT